MKKIGNGYWKEESRYTVSIDGIHYVREECKMLYGFHTIKWTYDSNDEETLHYYSKRGWSDDSGFCNINQAAPFLENEFQRIK